MIFNQEYKFGNNFIVPIRSDGIKKIYKLKSI